MPRRSQRARATIRDRAPDEAAIRAVAKDYTSREKFWSEFGARYPPLADAIRLSSDMLSLAALSNKQWPDIPRRLRTRALRILLRRLGKLSTRFVLAAAMPVSSAPIRLTLEPRSDSGYPDKGRSRRLSERAYQDAKLLVAFHKYSAKGLPFENALSAAAKEIGAISRGFEGIRKALIRARKAARQRGYVEPLAPTLTALTGERKRPSVRVAELSSRGRPKKGQPPK